MIWNPFKAAPQKFLGIDIGTSSIKIVELSRSGERKKLENYGEISALALYEKPFRTFEKNTLYLRSQEIAKAILAIFAEAGMQARQACLSIPDFSTFYTSFWLPAMTTEELPEAVSFEARQHIPLPLSEVTLDWQVIESETAAKNETSRKILLVAVPNEVINQYQAIANLIKLEISTLEAEVFGLTRALTTDKSTIGLLDIGAQSTTISIIKDGVLTVSHSFDIAGNEFANRISKALGVDLKEAEEVKKKQGLRGEERLREVLKPIIDLILSEVEKISQDFYSSERKKIEKFILAGGTAFLPGLKEYFSEKLKKEVEIASPFSNIFYPPILKETLEEMGPSYAIAIGAALRGLD
jgi:type IV pilus assembly protein PilM